MESEPTLRPGQRVRLTYILDGQIGPTEVDFRADAGGGFWWHLAENVLASLGVPFTVEVLADPRIPEPKGLGAVVEASIGSSGKRRRFTLVDTRSGEVFRWYAASIGWYKWDQLIDPVLLSEGWTDG